LLEAFETPVLKADTVYEYGGRTAYTYPTSFVDIPIDKGLDCGILPVFVELLNVQTEILCHLYELRITQISVILEDFVVEFPVLALPGGRQGGLGTGTGSGMVWKRKMLCDDFDFFGVFLQHLLE